MLLPNRGKGRLCRDDGDGEFDRFCASVRKGDRDCNIEPSASPYAIMRRVHPYRGENIEPGKDDAARRMSALCGGEALPLLQATYRP
jgi:hypothetical protein